MEIKRVICKKQVPMKDKMSAVAIMASFDDKKLVELAAKKDKSLVEATQFAALIIQFDSIAQLFGFKDLQDMIDFVNIYGAESLLE